VRETKSLPTQTVLSCAIILPLFRNSFFFVHLFGNARMLHQSKALIIRELVRGFLHVSLTWPGGRSPVSNTIGPIPNVPGDMPIPSPHFTSSCECWTKHQTSRLTATFRDLEQQLGQDYDVQFLLVDDGSTDGTRKPVRRLTGFTGRFYAMSGTSLRAS